MRSFTKDEKVIEDDDREEPTEVDHKEEQT